MGDTHGGYVTADGEGFSSSSRPLRWASAIRATHSGGGAEGDAVAGQAGADRERDRQMRLHIM